MYPLSGTEAGSFQHCTVYSSTIRYRQCVSALTISAPQAFQAPAVLLCFCSRLTFYTGILCCPGIICSPGVSTEGQLSVPIPSTTPKTISGSTGLVRARFAEALLAPTWELMPFLVPSVSSASRTVPVLKNPAVLPMSVPMQSLYWLQMSCGM